MNIYILPFDINTPCSTISYWMVASRPIYQWNRYTMPILYLKVIQNHILQGHTHQHNHLSIKQERQGINVTPKTTKVYGMRRKLWRSALLNVKILILYCWVIFIVTEGLNHASYWPITSHRNKDTEEECQEKKQEQWQLTPESSIDWSSGFSPIFLVCIAPDSSSNTWYRVTTLCWGKDCKQMRGL